MKMAALLFSLKFTQDANVLVGAKVGVGVTIFTLTVISIPMEILLESSVNFPGFCLTISATVVLNFWAMVASESPDWIL